MATQEENFAPLLWQRNDLTRRIGILNKAADLMIRMAGSAAEMQKQAQRKGFTFDAQEISFDPYEDAADSLEIIHSLNLEIERAKSDLLDVSKKIEKAEIGL